MSVTRIGYFRVGFGAQGVEDVDLLGVPVSGASLSLKRKKPGELSLTWIGIDDPALLDDPLIAENKVIRWSMGYIPDGMSTSGPRRGEQVVGVYLIKKIDVGYKADGQATLKLALMDKGVKLSDDSVPTIFTQTTLSDMVREIGDTLGMKVDAEETELVHEHVVMGDSQTFGEKMTELADDEDFEFWVEDDTIYLRKARYKGPPTLEVGWRCLTPATLDGVFLQDFKTTADYKGRSGGKKKRSGGKDKDGKPISATDDNPLAGGGSSGNVRVTYNQNKSFTPESVSETANVSTPKDGTRSASPLKNEKHMRARNSSQSKFIGLKGQKCSGNLHGFLLQPRHFISVIGVRRADGVPWMVDSVKYDYKEGDIKLSFQGLIEPAERDKGSRSTDGKTGTKNSSSDRAGGAGGKGAVRVKYVGRGATAVSSVTN